MRNYVLDSYAVLTYFQDESGAAEVERLLAEAAAGETALFLTNCPQRRYLALAWAWDPG